MRLDSDSTIKNRQYVSHYPRREERNWITHDVIPSIRKHGAYMTEDVLKKSIENPDFLIGILQNLKQEQETRKKLELEAAKQKQLIGELQPKADYVDTILHSKATVYTSQISKDYGMSAKKLNKLLHELKVQYKVGDQWLLYANIQDCGYTHSETVPTQYKDGTPGPLKMITKWTQKGHLFLYNLLKSNGIVPMIEKGEGA